MAVLYGTRDYKKFVLERLTEMPKRGHGQFQRIAAAIKTHTTRVSHILRGELHFTIEQACDLCRYLGLNELETEYFLALVQHQRAGTPRLRQVVEKQLTSIEERALQLVNRVGRDKVLSDEKKAVFYSSWMYAAIRQACSISDLASIDGLARRFDLPREKVRNIVDFLIESGLCSENLEGRLSIMGKMTHLEASSPLVVRHHANWRIKAMQHHERLTNRELAYTAPMSISAVDQARVREMSATFIEKVLEVVRASEPEQKLMCLNLDWFEV